MKDDEILNKTRTISKHLEYLRTKHLSVTSENTEYRRSSIMFRKSIESTQIGFAAPDIVTKIASHVKYIENLKSDNRSLLRENAILREKILTAEKNLEESASMIEKLEKQAREFEEFANFKASAFPEKTLQDDFSPESLVNKTFDIPQSDQSTTGRFSETPISTTERTSKRRESKERKSFTGEEQHLKILEQLICENVNNGRPDIAHIVCNQAIYELRKVGGPSDPDIPAAMIMQAKIFKQQNKYEKAIEILKKALKIQEKILGDDHPVIAKTLAHLVVLYGTSGNHKRAEPLSKRALEISEKELGENHPEIAKLLNNLGLLCQNQEKYREAETYYRRALKILEKLIESRFKGFIPRIQINLANCFVRQNRLGEGEILFKTVLSAAMDGDRTPIWEIAEECDRMKIPKVTENLMVRLTDFKTDLSSVMTAIKNMSFLYRHRGMYVAAEIVDEYYRKCKANGKDEFKI